MKEEFIMTQGPEFMIDDYHTYCKYCECVKENFMFTPSELKNKLPRCRECRAKINSSDVIRPGVKPGYAWRGTFLPRRSSQEVSGFRLEGER